MADLDGEITVKPEIMLLEDVLGQMAAGRLRVPRFQRPFVWRPDQMLNLFDSIERGYPIGSLLVWDTSEPLPSLEQVAGIDIPRPQETPVAYLLDGHQRLSTLFGCLTRRPVIGDPQSQQQWKWDVYRELGTRHERGGSSRYRHWKSTVDTPATYLPMRAVLRTMDFLAYARRISGLLDPAALDAMVDEAEQVAQRIKSYKLAVVRLVGGRLEHAVEVFSRLNSSGQSMTPDQMVSALTYNPEGGESLADRIATIKESLADVGFGPIPSITIFRSVLAVAGEEDVQEARWEALADRVRGRLADAVDASERSLRQAVDFLRDEVGVPLSRLVPYNLQIMLLVAFFHLNSDPSDGQRRSLVRWFWATSWSGYFAGANTTQVKNELAEMRAFALGEGGLRLDALTARPFPERFDLRSARVRTFVLWDLKEFGHRRRSVDGAPFDALRVLATADTDAYRRVITTSISSGSHPANRLILPTPPGVSLRKALAALPAELEDSVLTSHGIPRVAVERLRDGDLEGFIKERAAHLADRERSFMVTLGVEPAVDIQGDADIDTE
ncbi:DUF262 domain-containing protein [Dactylosporangium aurantiacum]|uniref:DUF262 domain-containing protein n=1 Tax=Dactylosporangium aurantiacum TaxID=35754 RepID=A0A9Q9MJ91_9ACTN|nr:DUF262 domain-containing protein [Dactylosporangium aurantiacum]MDG6105165.1 DUF262 domain-containing protein [Dactylosporangium aurantiacum]UWZ51687.1 DUF262 domain-containing protein [Dactylosporangium aurantiacum]